MKRSLLLLAGFLLGAALVNARIDATRECGCAPDCWCKQPGLRHFRWVLPAGHKGVPPGWKPGVEGTGEPR